MPGSKAPSSADDNVRKGNGSLTTSEQPSASVPGYGAAEWKSIGDVPGLTGTGRTVSAKQRLSLEAVRTARRGRLRQMVGSVVTVLCENGCTVFLLVLAGFFLMYAEIIVGLCEAVPMQILDSVIPSGCSAKEQNDHHLIYLSCPILYLPDFRGVVRGSFVEDIVAGIDLRGLSISLQTEIYQWVEHAKCESCAGELTDNGGNCLKPTHYLDCVWKFSKAWVQEPVPSSTFYCQVSDGPDKQKECQFPLGGRPENVGTIPQAVAPFKKDAEDGSVSIGDYPARFYLSSALIEQIPSRRTPVFFKNESLPKVPGYVTTASGNSLHEEIRLEKNPGSPQPSVGDLRTHLDFYDFYSRDQENFVSVVAKQGPWTTTEPHRELIPWNSHTRSWTNTTDEEVQWLEEGIHSLGDMVAKRRAAEYADGKKLIVSFRILGTCSLLFAMLVFGGPLAKIWLGTRQWDSWQKSARDVGMLLGLLATSAIGIGLFLVAFPWLHFRRETGHILLASALLAVGISAGLLLSLDTKDNLRHVLEVSRSSDLWLTA